MTLREYVRLFRRGWLIVLVLAVIGVGAGNLLTFVTTPTYTSTAAVFISLRGDGTAGGLQQAAAATEDRAPTYASLATSTLVLDDAAGVVGAGVEELRAQTSAVVREGQAYIDITAQASTARDAQAWAQAVAEALTRQAPISDSPGPTPPLFLQVVTPAGLPTSPVTPRPRNNTLFGAVIGLAVGVGVVVVAHSLDNRIRGVSDLPRGLQLATITSLPSSRARGARTSTGGDVRLESFRRLRANLQFATRTGGVIAVAGVTSASVADEVASQLAAVLGEIELGVVVVDVDLRNPSGGRHTEASTSTSTPGPGVVDVLAGRATLDEVLHDGRVHGVWSVPAGVVETASAQLVSTAPMRELLLALEHRFDYVLLSCPPVVERSEASVLAALSRGSLLVVESGATSRAELVYALELLEGVGATSVSVALDHVRGLDLGRSPVPAPGAAPFDAPADR